MLRPTTKLLLIALVSVIASRQPVRGQQTAPATSNEDTAVSAAAAAPEPPGRIHIDRAATPMERDSHTVPSMENSLSLKDAWIHGGIIMWFILALSILGGALTIYLFFTLRPSQIIPRHLLSELRDTLSEGDLNAARRACERRSSQLALVTLAALDYIRNVPEADAPFLKDVIESEGGRQAEDMQSQTQFLLDLSVITPMLGLLGTVLGMLRAFGAIGQDFAAAKPVYLAQGVSQAIITTIFGLAVAIPCMVLYAHFRRRTVKMTALLEVAAAEILALVTRRSGK